MLTDETTAGPAQSVVVASFSGETALERCLSSLLPAAAGAEIVVATNVSPTAVTRLTARFPAGRFFTFPPETNVFQLRSRGLEQAHGQWIALLEDHCTVPSNWLAGLRAAHDAGHLVVGGPIDNGTHNLYGWALYLCEYCAYMPPVSEGRVRALLAANTSYSAPTLAACRAVWQDAFYDNEVHDALLAAGHTLYLAENARVESHLRLTLLEATAHLFAGGRRFGGYRKARASSWQRGLWLLAGPAIPAVLLARIFRRLWSRRADRLGTVLLGLPYLLCLVLAWAAGEALGYLAAPPAEHGGERTSLARGLSRSRSARNRPVPPPPTAPAGRPTCGA
jgi:hypothetical protein